MTLKDKIYDALFLEIKELRDKLHDRENMLERLKKLNEEDINSSLGIVIWYYKMREKTNGKN